MTQTMQKIQETPREIVQRCYRGRPGARISAEDAGAVGRAMERLAQEYRCVHAEHFIEISRPEDAETHHLLTWDDAIAGHRWRLKEASTLLRSVEIVIVRSDESREVRPLVWNLTVPVETEVGVGQERAYVLAEDAPQICDFSEQLAEKVTAELMSVVHSYSPYWEEIEGKLEEPYRSAVRLLMRGV